MQPLDPSGWEFYCGNCNLFRAARLTRECEPESNGEYFELACQHCASILMTTQHAMVAET